MSSDPRVVLGAPVFNKAEYLRTAVESLLGQTYGDFVLFLIDDRSEDDTLEIAQTLASEDRRVRVHRNERRLGMLYNTRLAFDLPHRELPGAELWALVSDHDIWESTWLERLVAALDERREAVLAYPLTKRIDEHGERYPGAKPPWRFDTVGIASPRTRLRAAYRGMVAGDMIYGLFRAEALDRVGTYRSVLVPDRLLLSELALLGEFVQVPELLWSRRFRGLADLERQRWAFFLYGPPPWTRLPWWQTHVALVIWEYAVRDKGVRLGLQRRDCVMLPVDYLRVAVRHRLWRRTARARKRLRPKRLRDRFVANVINLGGHWARSALDHPTVHRVVARHLAPHLRGPARKLDQLLEETANGRFRDRS